jgi:hypothetical protein
MKVFNDRGDDTFFILAQAVYASRSIVVRRRYTAFHIRRNEVLFGVRCDKSATWGWFSMNTNSSFALLLASTTTSVRDEGNAVLLPWA